MKKNTSNKKSDPVSEEIAPDVAQVQSTENETLPEADLPVSPNEADEAPESCENAYISQLEAQLAEAKDRLLRSAAEFDNYKKRSQKEKESLSLEVKANVVSVLLPVLDNLERALSHSNSDEGTLTEGLTLVHKQFEDSLAALHVTQIESLGAPFDPQRHNAVMHITDEEVAENTIVEVFQQGYCIGEKVIRHSMVKVAN